MPATLLSDSSLDFQLLPLGGAGLRPDDPNLVADSLPRFDLNSDEALPDFLTDLAFAALAPTAAPPPAEPLPVVPLAPRDGAAGSAAERVAERAAGSLWLEGDVLMCACPDCSAPMSVRLWLMVADCWNCAASIELSEEQEREAMRLIQAREKAEARAAAAAAPAVAAAANATPAAIAAAQRRERPAPERPRMVPPSERGRATAGADSAAAKNPSPSPSPPATLPAKPGRGESGGIGSRTAAPAPAAAGATAAAQPNRRVSAAANMARRRLEKTRGAGLWAFLIHNTPAWLVSLVVHLVALTLLGLLTFPLEEDEKYITLNANVHRFERRAGEAKIEQPTKDPEFDLPVPQEADLNNKQVREALLRADQEARELRLIDASDPQLPDIEKIKQQIGSHSGATAAVAARDPRVRVEMVEQEGGTTLTEAAVARGLRFLAAEQQADGRWRLEGGVQSDSAATSLALMPFLGAGQTHLTGRYKDNVAKGLRWLVQNQKPDGDLRANSTSNAGMYAHGQAAIVLCEAFLMTGDEALREPAQKAIDFIVAGQYRDGGWRYRPKGEASPGEQRGDTSVVGWQLMALQSARAANLNVPDETMELASHYLDAAQTRDGKQYCYQPNHAPSHVMTAEALLCRIYMGMTLDDPNFQAGVENLAQNHLPHAGAPDMYYWYYGTQTFHHVGGDLWEQWNLRMRDVLVNSQDKTGRNAGSWSPRGGHDGAGGRIYTTALAVCSLEVYYRHLPIFRQIKVDPEGDAK